MTSTSLHQQPLPTVRADELDTEPSEQRWLIETLWAHSGVGIIGGSPRGGPRRALSSRFEAS